MTPRSLLAAVAACRSRHRLPAHRARREARRERAVAAQAAQPAARDRRARRRTAIASSRTAPAWRCCSGSFAAVDGRRRALRHHAPQPDRRRDVAWSARFFGIAGRLHDAVRAASSPCIQVLVYAGAIMVLFVFVIMILNRDEDEPVAPSRARRPRSSAALALVYLVGRLVDAARSHVDAAASPTAPPRRRFGTRRARSATMLFTDYLFAVRGGLGPAARSRSSAAVVVARSTRSRSHAGADGRRDRGRRPRRPARRRAGASP